MSKYYLSNGTFHAVPEQSDELCHYGVPGMKWGHRKSNYITVRQSLKRAKTAGQDAWRKTTVENGGKLLGKNKSIAVYKNPRDKMRGKRNARKAYNTEIIESIKADKATNKAARVSAKLTKKNTKRGEDYLSTHADRMMSKKVSNMSLERRKVIDDMLFPTKKHKNDTFSERPTPHNKRPNI